MHDRLTILSEFDDLVEFIFSHQEYESQLLVGKKQTAASTRQALQQLLAALLKLESWDQEPWEATVRQVAADREWKAGELFMALRVAVTYSTASPPLRESMELLGRDESIRRIEAAIKKLD